jgi:hypothetical protein
MRMTTLKSSLFLPTVIFPHQSPLAYVSQPKSFVTTKGYYVIVTTNIPVNIMNILEGNIGKHDGGRRVTAGVR